MAPAAGFEPDVIALSVQIFLRIHLRVAVGAPLIGPAMRGRGLTVLRMEVKQVPGQGLAVAAVVYVEVKRSDLQQSLVSDGNARVFLKGHGKVTVQSLVRSCRQGERRIEKVVSRAEAEKISDGRLHAGRRLPIPINPQYQCLQVIRIVTRNRDPDMADQPRT